MKRAHTWIVIDFLTTLNDKVRGELAHFLQSLGDPAQESVHSRKILERGGVKRAIF